MRWNKIYIGLLLIALFSFSTPKKAPQVTAVYPSLDTLPENVLRLYVRFSDAMKTVDNLKKIKLFDEDNHEVKSAIFNNVYELWDKEQKQLTLIFDPARVKSGLVANETFGRALKPGKTYRLLIENLESVLHQKVKPFEKQFTVINADTIAPKITHWKFELPPAVSTKPLKISFAETVDIMSLYHRLLVTDAQGKVIEGRISVGFKEKNWKFTPTNNWQKGNYTIHVNTRFADPSGNNLNGLFDHKIGTLKYSKEGEIITIPFSL